MNRIAKLREKKELNQTQLGKLVNAAQNTVSNWENGNRIPDYETLKVLSNIFNCSIEYIMGDSNEPNPKRKDIHQNFLSEIEKQIIIAYRRKPEMQAAVNKLLGIEDPYTMTVYKVAESENNSPEGYVPMNQSRWEEMDSKPKTDDDLL